VVVYFSFYRDSIKNVQNEIGKKFLVGHLSEKNHSHALNVRKQHFRKQHLFSRRHLGQHRPVGEI